jgi:hypothetical protein
MSRGCLVRVKTSRYQRAMAMPSSFITRPTSRGIDPETRTGSGIRIAAKAAAAEIAHDGFASALISRAALLDLEVVIHHVEFCETGPFCRLCGQSERVRDPLRISRCREVSVMKTPVHW